MICKIALVDSGLDVNLYKNYITEFIDFGQNEEEPFIGDTNGHGTLCCSAILAVNPQVEIIAVKVLNEHNKCSSPNLILALEQLTDTNVDIINLSLSSDATEYLEDYRKVTDKLQRQNKVILAATSNRGNTSTIAGLPGTIGISGKMFEEKELYWYAAGKAIQCVANSTPLMLKGRNGQYELFGGSSKATALFGGFVSRFWPEVRDMTWDEKEKFFERRAARNNWQAAEFNQENTPSLRLPEEIRKSRLYQEIWHLLINELNITKADTGDLYRKRLYEFGITKTNAITIIQSIEKTFDIKIDYSKVNLYWFYSLDLLFRNVTEAMTDEAVTERTEDITEGTKDNAEGIKDNAEGTKDITEGTKNNTEGIKALNEHK